MSKNYTILQLDKHTWRLEDPFHTYLYLVEGTERAALIDCGNGFSGLGEAVASLTGKPVIAVLTHGHFDHTGCASMFQECLIHPADQAVLEQGFAPAERAEQWERFCQLYQVAPSSEEREFFLSVHVPKITGVLSDGQVLDLGGRTLEVITTPGHTLGSVCLLDKIHGYLFSGDMACDNEVLVYFDHSATVEDVLESDRKPLTHRNKFVQIWPGHHRSPLDAGILEDYVTAAQTVLADPTVGTRVELPDGYKLLYEYKTIGISYCPGHVNK